MAPPKVFPSPPPRGNVTPVLSRIQAGDVIHRIYDPTRHGATAFGYRYSGPYARFDHHLAGGSNRGILYAARTYEGCIVEVSDDNLVDIGSRRHVALELVESLSVLDLRGNGAMRAGVDARIGKCAHDDSQPWARYFYETASYAFPAGILWLNSHNDADAFAFFERAGSAFRIMTDVALLDEIDFIAETTERCGLTINFASVK